MVIKAASRRKSITFTVASSLAFGAIYFQLKWQISMQSINFNVFRWIPSVS